MQGAYTRRDPDTGHLQEWRSNGQSGRWVTIDASSSTRAVTKIQSAELIKPESTTLSAKVTESVNGDHQNRAKAFEIRTRVLSFAFGGAAMLLWFIARWAFPRLSGQQVGSFALSMVVAVSVGLTVFVIVWAGAYVLDLATSPGGIALLESWWTQRRLDKQSNAMIKAFNRANDL